MTPNRLRMTGIVLILLGLTSGLASLLTMRQRADLAHEMRGGGSGPGASALDIYPSLSDADASAASAFLTGGPESSAARARYEGDIARAAAAITVASHNGDDASVRVLVTLTSGLPVYTGLVERARAIDREGVPLGVAYLREASGLMRNTLLPAAKQVYQTENDRVDDAQPRVTVFPWAVVIVGLLTFAGLVVAQVHLSRRTHRFLNVGLALAMVAALATTLLVAGATASASRHVRAARHDGLAQIQLLAQARIDAAQARADEALTLLARGNGQAFEQDFVKTMADLVGTDGAGGLLAQARDGAPDAARRATIETARQHALQWRSVHRDLRTLDDGGDYPKAVQMAIGTEPTGGATVFGQFEAALGRGLADSNGRFDQETSRAVDDLAGFDVAVALLTALLVIGISAGLQRRVAEYR